MKKLVLIAAFLIVPFAMSAQNDKPQEKETVKASINTEIAIKKVERISADPKLQNKNINFKKSNELISVKAYMKSLRMKRKITVVS